MISLLRLLPVLIAGFSRSRRDLLLENLALRQQLIAFAAEISTSTSCCLRQVVLAALAALVGWVEAGADYRAA
jgi:hypothetical protein